MKYKLVIIFLLVHKIIVAQWVQTNKLNNPTISRIEVYNNKILAGTYGGGLFISEDNGNAWKSLNKGLMSAAEIAFNSNLLVSSVAAFDQNIVLAGLYDVFLSNNDGQSWTVISDRLLNYNSSAARLATNGIDFFAACADGFYVSSDAGNSWVRKAIPAFAYSFGISIVIKGDNIYVASNNRIYNTNNKGDSWTEYNPGMNNIYIKSIALYDSSLFIGTNIGVYTSNNQGLTWQVMNNGFIGSVYINSLLVKDSLLLAATFDGIYCSVNSLNNWTKLNDVNIIDWKVSGNNIYGGIGNKGFAISTDNGLSWTELNNGLINSEINFLASTASNMYAAAGPTIYVNKPNSDEWEDKTKTESPLSIFYLNVSVKSIGNTLYASGQGYTLSYSVDEGETWNPMCVKYCQALAQKGSQLFVGAVVGMLVTTVDGKECTTLNNGLMYPAPIGTSSIPYITPQNISCLKVINNKIFAGTHSGKIFVSTDDGNNWVATSFDSLSQSHASVVAIVSIGDLLFAGVYGKDGVFMSDNFGKSWKLANNGITNGFPDYNSFAVTCMTTFKNNIIVGTNTGGIFVSNNNGQNWENVNQGLNSYFISSMEIFNNDIYLGTRGGGVWKRPVSEIIRKLDVNSCDDILSIYPNPFANVTFIQSAIKLKNATLILSDIHGKTVKQINNINDDFIILSRENISDGLYFVSILQENNLLSSCKLVIGPLD